MREKAEDEFRVEEEPDPPGPSPRPQLQVPPRSALRSPFFSPSPHGSASSAAPLVSSRSKSPTSPAGALPSDPPQVPPGPGGAPASGPSSPPSFFAPRNSRAAKSVVFAAPPKAAQLSDARPLVLSRSGSVGREQQTPSFSSDLGSGGGGGDPDLFNDNPEVAFSEPLANPFPFRRPNLAGKYRSGELRLGFDGPTPIGRPNAIQKSVIMCMDPTCNKCPPEMHALRNQKLMEKLQKATRESDDDDEDESRRGGLKGGGGKEDKFPTISLQEELDAELEAELQAEEEQLGPGQHRKRDPEAGRRMVIRICGLRIVLHPHKRNPFLLRLVRFFRDLRASLHFNPNNPYIHLWNEFFMLAALLGFFFDPLFFFVYTSDDTYPYISLNRTLALVFTIIMSVVQLWYLLHIIITFRTAYVVPPPRESWWSGHMVKDPSGLPPGDLCFNSPLIARYYITSGVFFLDLVSVLPLPQVLVMVVVPSLEESNLGAVFMCLLILLQVFPRAIRLSLKIMGENSVQSEIFDSAWAQFGINLFLYFLSAHIVGSIWYLFSVQRVQQCMDDVTKNPGEISTSPGDTAPPALFDWCTNPPQGEWGIFQAGMNYVSKPDFFVRYLGSLYWGFQQLSTLAGNQVPSPWAPELVFILLVSCLGLLLLALLIGNMSNFLQALSRKSFEYQMNKRDVQNWMYRRNIPNRLQRRVNELLRLQWATTRGVEDNEVLPLLTEDLQRELRKRLCEKLLTVSPLFSAMNQQLLDAFLARLQQLIYIDGTVIVKEGYPVSRMFFVLKGQVLRSSNKSGMMGNDQMSLGEFVGEEVLVQYVDKYSRSGAMPTRFSQSRGRELWAQSRAAGTMGRGIAEPAVDVLPQSRFTALCVGPVEGYCLEAKDVETVCRQYWKFLQDEKVQLALKRCSRTRMMHYARTIQLAWRRYQRCKYRISMADCVRAAMEKKFYSLINLKKSESTDAKMHEAHNGADDDDDVTEEKGAAKAEEQ